MNHFDLPLHVSVEVEEDLDSSRQKIFEEGDMTFEEFSARVLNILEVNAYSNAAPLSAFQIQQRLRLTTVPTEFVDILLGAGYCLNLWACVRNGDTLFYLSYQ